MNSFMQYESSLVLRFQVPFYKSEGAHDVVLVTSKDRKIDRMVPFTEDLVERLDGDVEKYFVCGMTSNGGFDLISEVRNFESV